MITVTIVRHGESTDNLRTVWAGWADAPLSNHGMNQAKALGESYADTHVDSIYASPLLRAHWTSQQIEKHQPEPKPPLTVSPLLREQHFGVAERQPFGSQAGGYVREPGRTFKFPEGESLDDVRKRANDAIAQFVEPALRKAHGKAAKDTHLVFVAHGIFNSEFLGAFLARRFEGVGTTWGYKGMTNTGWTRLEVGYADELVSDAPVVSTDPEGPVSESSAPPPGSAPPSVPIDKDLPPLSVRILCTDVHKHLDGVHRQGGGIGSAGYDAKQSDLRAFFGGAQPE